MISPKNPNLETMKEFAEDALSSLFVAHRLIMGYVEGKADFNDLENYFDEIAHLRVNFPEFEGLLISAFLNELINTDWPTAIETHQSQEVPNA